MVVIAVQTYAEAKVYTIKVGNKKLFYVKMIDVQKGLGLKNMPDLVKNKDVVFLKQKTLSKNKRKNI